MSDNQNDQRNAPEKRKLSMTLGLGFALGVAALGFPTRSYPIMSQDCRQENKSNNPPNSHALCILRSVSRRWGPAPCVAWT